MSITYYGPGDHASGFIGFRVTRAFNGNYLQAYFSTLPAGSQSDDDSYFRYQHLRARHQDLAWEVESLWYQYRQFVTQSRGNTRPERGLGVHGITALFARGYGGKWEPCFSVSRPKQPGKRFMLCHYPYSEAWREAVTLWADEYQILEEDRDRVLKNPPDPEQFKRLRRQMNDHEGHNIPVEALGPVFKEQRERIAQMRLRERARHLAPLSRPATQESREKTEAEMLAWFERERAG